MEFIYQHKKGIIGAVIFHLIVLALLLLLGFFTPLPLPGEEGILVNFGNSENGLGDTDPAPARIIQPVVEEKEETPPPAVTPPPKAQSEPKTQEKENTLTQDFEESAAIEAAKKKKAEDDKIKRENAEKERKRLEELDRQKQAELEKQRLAEAERKKKEEDARKIAEINSRTKGAFERSGTGSGGAGTGTGQSQGVTFPGGNQGVPTGDPNASTYGPGGKGSGTQGTGPSYSLAGRSARSLPLPNYPGNEEGTVVVQVTVDKNGNVTKAEAGFRGSTTMNPSLLDAAQKAALQAKFNTDSNAPAFQVGTITYKFSLE